MLEVDTQLKSESLLDITPADDSIFDSPKAEESDKSIDISDEEEKKFEPLSLK